jgi:predicted MFS family arabinose efflux permease
MLASLGVGAILGRFICGLALDRFPANIVSAVVMGLPIIGLVLFASPIDTQPALMAAVFLFGFSNGAEIDVIAFLIARKFGTNIYSSVFGVMTVALVSSASCGAILLSIVLAKTNSFTPFLWGSALLVSIGCILFLVQKMPKGYEARASVS